MKTPYKQCKYKGKMMRYHVVMYLLAHGLDFIPHGYVIHHKDFDKMNNDVDNLVCITNSEHAKIHVMNRNRINGRFA